MPSLLDQLNQNQIAILLQKILQTNHTICAVALESSQTNPFYNHLFPIQTDTEEPSNIHLDSFARQNSLPLIIFKKHLNHYFEDINNYSPDIIIVSCFGKKLPNEILSIPTYGCFNLHPSLLPKFRGPTPVFWQFRNGSKHFGVTLHRMTDNFDCGGIIKQSSTELSDGIHHLQAKSLLANIAADLITNVLDDFTCSIKNLMPQDKQSSSYHSYPTLNDYKINTKWSAKRVYNFIKAYQGNNTVFPCEVTGHVYNLVEAISYDSNADIKFNLTNDLITLPCSHGCLQAKVQPL